MAPLTWQYCFGFIYIYNRANQFPPFATRPKQAYFTLSFFVIFLIRILITILSEGVQTFERLIMTLYFCQTTAKSFLFVRKKEQFEKHLNGIDEFLADINVNPIDDRENHFMHLWDKRKPSKYSMMALIYQVSIVMLYVIEVLHVVITDAESLKENIYPYYSPFFGYNLFTKWAYLICEISIDFISTFLHVYEHVMCLTFMTFQMCEFIYLKDLATEMFDGSGKKLTRKNIVWWINRHQACLIRANEVKELLQTFMSVTYLHHACDIAISIVILVKEMNATNFMLTAVTPLFILITVLQFGWLCNIAEKMDEEHAMVVEKAYSAKTFLSGKWNTAVYKMVTMRTQKPFRIKALYFFTMNRESFKDLIWASYSFATTLINMAKAR